MRSPSSSASCSSAPAAVDRPPSAPQRLWTPAPRRHTPLQRHIRRIENNCHRVQSAQSEVHRVSGSVTTAERDERDAPSAEDEKPSDQDSGHPRRVSGVRCCEVWIRPDCHTPGKEHRSQRACEEPPGKPPMRLRAVSLRHTPKDTGRRRLAASQLVRRRDAMGCIEDDPSPAPLPPRHRLRNAPHCPDPRLNASGTTRVALSHRPMHRSTGQRSIDLRGACGC